MNGAWIYVVEFWLDEECFGKWPTDAAELARFVSNWIVEGKCPQ